MRTFRILLAALALIIAAPANAADMRDETVEVPARQGSKAIRLTATIYAPRGNGPFPLVVINHGKSAGNPSRQADSRFYPEALQFVKRGYAVVVPIRAGFGTSGGTYVSTCEKPLAALGRIWADDVRAVIDYARTLPYVDAQRIVVIGASQGGLVAAALGASDVPGLVGIVNFSGGLRQDRCKGWPDRNIAAFRAYGAKTRVPALFLYGDNDLHWGNGELSHRFFDAYHAGNPRSTYVDTGTFEKGSSHYLFESFDGLQVWVPLVGEFFRSLGLNWDETRDLRHPGPGVALEDVDAVPFQNRYNTIRRGYERFLLMDPKAGRAFALSPNGAWSRQSGRNAAAKAVANCTENRGVDCRLYAVDDRIVYRDQAGKRR
jgi:dienelactone hydrolase